MQYQTSGLSEVMNSHVWFALRILVTYGYWSFFTECWFALCPTAWVCTWVGGWAGMWVVKRKKNWSELVSSQIWSHLILGRWVDPRKNFRSKFTWSNQIWCWGKPYFGWVGSHKKKKFSRNLYQTKSGVISSGAGCGGSGHRQFFPWNKDVRS